MRMSSPPHGPSVGHGYSSEPNGFVPLHPSIVERDLTDFGTARVHAI